MPRATAARTCWPSLGPGETLGELSLFDPAPRNATATVVAESTLYSLSQQDLYRVLAQRPEVGRHLLASLARRLRKTNESLADLVFADVPGRVRQERPRSRAALRSPDR